MTENSATQQKKKRFRSPPYPMFDLAQAIERAKLVHQVAQRHPVGADVIRDAWSLKSVDGKLWRAAAALIQYGLLLGSGSGKSRKFQITDTANRIILDENEQSEKRAEALRAAALTPMINKELWSKFQTAKSLSDTVIKTYLTLDRGDAGESVYSSSAADEVLGRYRASLVFAGLTEDIPLPGSDKLQDEIDDSLPGMARISVGDLIKWTSNGVDQFVAKKVEWISEDNSFLRVEGSQTGILLDEVEKVTPRPGDESNKPIPDFGAEGQESGKPDAATKRITANVEGGRLKITADVDAKEIDSLQKMLSKYQEILKMLA